MRLAPKVFNLVGKMCCLHLFLYSLVLVSLSQATFTHSWGWFSSPASDTNSIGRILKNSAIIDGAASEFSMETIGNQKGMKLVENAKLKMVGPYSCWRQAYANLFAGCSEIIADKEKQSRLAWDLSDCFQKESGRTPFPSCDAYGPMTKCLKNLDDNEHTIYLEFFLETNSICHQLQADAFKHETERLVNDLRRSAQFAEDELDNIDERSEQLLQETDRIYQSMASVDEQIELVAQTSKSVEEQIDVVMNYSKVIFDQSQEIAASQIELQGGQRAMTEKLQAGIAILHESHQNLGRDMERLRSEAEKIEMEINEVGNAMSSKMKHLQSKADNIGDIAGVSLDKQKQLLDGQSTALEGLEFLTKFQSVALEESRSTLQMLAEFGKKQQEELLQRQEQLQRAHDGLVRNSKSILEAQEAFEVKQINMFKALDKLFALHNAILRESRSIKAFFFYSFSVIILYMVTSAKQTYCVRARLFLGLSTTFLVEFFIFRFGTNFERQAWAASLARVAFILVAATQIILSIFTYRDYEVLNHKMLLTLLEKLNIIEEQKMELEMDSDKNSFSWIDKELPEDVDHEDPDYVWQEEVGENSIATTSITRKYDLRPRHRY
ncbi:hypothetical protein Syun_015269 [Stephania yunnanensis]|uniref:Protein GAMETE EXPRESSED 1 n=1 Tax=Stephania yunnanensis TaxID=152371 RepID=A0AAP0PAF1_9MAGN